MNDSNEKLLLQIRSIRRILMLGVFCLAGLLSTSIYNVVRDVMDRKEQYARDHTFNNYATKLADEAMLVGSLRNG